MKTQHREIQRTRRGILLLWAKGGAGRGCDNQSPLEEPGVRSKEASRGLGRCSLRLAGLPWEERSFLPPAGWSVEMPSCGGRAGGRLFLFGVVDMY